MDTLGKIKKIGGKDGLNFVAELYDSVEELSAIQESLPLYGYEILVKDNIDVKGLHTTAGSLALEDNLASKDAPIIANLRKMEQ